MTYDQLYRAMVNTFTIEKDNKDYNLGDFMLMKARKKRNELTAATSSNLPVAQTANDGALVSILAYVNDKLTVKEAPVRDRTMRRFPLRTSLSAFASALVVCTLVISCGIFGFGAMSSAPDNTVVAPVNEDIEQNETSEDTSGFISHCA